VYKMMLAYRYVNGDAPRIERAARKIQSWWRGRRVREAFKFLVFRARVTNAYLPRDLRERDSNIGDAGSDFAKLMSRFSAAGDEEVPAKLDALKHLSESNAQKISALIIEHRRMSRTVDSVALLVRKLALGL
jgi:hypothetical protein